MLKTLKLASYLAVVLAVCGIGAMVVLGLKGDPEMREYLGQPSITKQLKERFGGKETPTEKDAPLVTQAQNLALRFDPPPPPLPKTVTPAPKPEVARSVPKPQPPKQTPVPKVQKSVQFDLLATVVYETAPEKSLALLKTAGNKEEWFRQGERLGHHEIKEIRDGSVVFTQSGQKPQEVFVPAEPQVKSILKDDKSASAAQRRGPGSITVQEGQPESPSITPAAKEQADESDVVRAARSTRTLQPQRAGSTPTPTPTPTPTRRVRTVPPQTPEEQQKSIKESISGIQEIMTNVESQGMSEEEKKEQQESFKLLLEMLSSENKRLEEEARKQAVGREKPAESEANNQGDANSEDTTETDAEASK